MQASQPFRVNKVRIEGAERTRGAVIERELYQFHDARTLGEVIRSLNSATAALRQLGIFKSVTITMQEVRLSGDAEEGNRVSSDLTDLVVKVEEKGPFLCVPL